MCRRIKTVVLGGGGDNDDDDNGACCREKKHAADQRIAELQALIALANGGAAGTSSFYGHGIVNPYAAYDHLLVRPIVTHAAWFVCMYVCVCVCWSLTAASCAIMAKHTEMPFAVWTREGQSAIY